MIDERKPRKALEAKADEARVPKDLSARTLKATSGAGGPSILRRVRSWRPIWSQSRRYSRWLYAPAAVALAVGLFALGTVVTRPPVRTAEQPAVATQDRDFAGEAKGATGVVSPGRASADSTTSSNTFNAPASQPAPAPVPPDGGAGTFPPKVVKNADIQVQVKREGFDRAWSRALNVASRYGGFVTNSSTQQTDSRISSGNFTLRVPAPKLESALKDLRGLGTLKSLTTSGNDISAQIVDIDGRIRALQAEQAQLLELLKQAEKISDILPIRTQLQNVQQELESLRGQKKGFQNQVDYATVNASIFEPNAAPEPLDDGVILRAWRTAVGAGLTIVAGMLVVLGGLIPLALIAIGVWALVAMARRRRT
jgi:uncharacterized protein DUF4349